MTCAQRKWRGNESRQPAGGVLDDVVGRELALRDAGEAVATGVGVFAAREPVLVERPQRGHARFVHVVRVLVIDVDAHRAQRAARVRDAHHAFGEDAVLVDDEPVDVELQLARTRPDEPVVERADLVTTNGTRPAGRQLPYE